MSSMVSEQPVRAQNKNHRKNSNFSISSQKKFKHDRNSRKRSKSFSGGGCKMKNMQPVLPTKFLLGGNINDPLNLNSLQDEKINKAMNAVTPKSSPIPTPPGRKGKIEVIIPPNINDPLNLIDCADDAEYEQQLSSPIKKGRKKRIKKRRTTSGNMDNSDGDTTIISEAKTPETNKDSAKIPEEATDIPKPKELTLELSPKKDKVKRKSEEYKDIAKKIKYSMDKIVSPVIPQPGAWLKRTNSHHWNQKPNRKQNKNPNQQLPQFKEKNKQFQYGNYNRYYGYRNLQNEIDPRLKCLANHRYLLETKDILDIGCNVGHITLSVARDFGAKSVVGIDIDKKLISIARKNIKHYVSSESPSRESELLDNKNGRKKSSEFFPISMPILYGPIDIPGFSDKKKGHGFPNNVTFVQGNYVIEDDNVLSMEQSQFDVILCLSITKWIHLNWGDSGIKRAFKRMFTQLRPGGKLILEPQNWTSYKSKRNLTEATYNNYNSIELFPDKFTQYLLSPEIGFAKSEILGFPQNFTKGFQRPIHIYTKSTIPLSERVECSTTSNASGNKVYLPTDIKLPSSVSIDGLNHDEEEEGSSGNKISANNTAECDEHSNCQSNNKVNVEGQKSINDKTNFSGDNT